MYIHITHPYHQHIMGYVARICVLTMSVYVLQWFCCCCFVALVSDAAAVMYYIMCDKTSNIHDNNIIFNITVSCWLSCVCFVLFLFFFILSNWILEWWFFYTHTHTHLRTHYHDIRCWCACATIISVLHFILTGGPFHEYVCVFANHSS